MQNEKAPKEKKPKKTAESQPESPFSTETKINKYGFIYLSGDILTAFGVEKGKEAKLTLNKEGDALKIRKA